jgi:hypothetical protein
MEFRIVGVILGEVMNNIRVWELQYLLGQVAGCEHLSERKYECI